ncbi:MAG: hypothetical protein ABSB59_30965 [Streptosporangiaceae bacterium]
MTPKAVPEPQPSSRVRSAPDARSATRVSTARPPPAAGASTARSWPDRTGSAVETFIPVSSAARPATVTAAAASSGSLGRRWASSAPIGSANRTVVTPIGCTTASGAQASAKTWSTSPAAMTANPASQRGRCSTCHSSPG